MQAKSDLLATAKKPTAKKAPKKSRRGTGRMPVAERRAQVLSKAYDFFAEYGLTAQTRALADACGISQRLLYSLFPNKAALLAAVYEAEIARPIKALWFPLLRDRQRTMEDRLNAFYKDYYQTILTRRWLRFFLYSSLAEVSVAPKYIAAIVTQLVELIVAETAHEAGLKVPEDDPALVQEIGWILHGAVSHLAIRRQIYRDDRPVDAERAIELHVKLFVAGLGGLLDQA